MTTSPFKALGDGTSYAVYTDMFDPSLLEPISRQEGRVLHDIYGTSMSGWDVWHGYESTFLLDNGYPVAGTLKIVYPSNSEFMVESKSMKLYLNSFDMCKMGDTLENGILNYENQIRQDLSDIVRAEVTVKFHDSRDFGVAPKGNPLDGYSDVAALVPGIDRVFFDDYTGKGNHVKTKGYPGETKFFTNALRSRCRHTKQKDTGLAMIHHKAHSNTLVDELSVFRQIVSLRELNEFHEFCAEKIFCEISKSVGTFDHLMVACLYSRRGSLDICPIRASSLGMIPSYLSDANILTHKVQGQ